MKGFQNSAALRWIVTVSTLLVLAMLAVTVFRFLTPKKQGFAFQHVVPVKTELLQEHMIARYYETYGTVEADNQVDLGADVSGKVVSIKFSEGQRVSQGTPLVLLKADKQVAQFEQSESLQQSAHDDLAVKSLEIERLESLLKDTEAQKRLVDTELHRYETLYKQELVSAQEVDIRRAQAQSAQTRVDVALKTLEQAKAEKRRSEMDWRGSASNRRYHEVLAEETQVKAPFSAVIGQKYISVGDYVVPGQKLLTLVDNQNLKIRFELPEKYMNAVGVQTPLVVTVGSKGDSKFRERKIKAEVIFVDPRIQTESRTVTVKAKILLEPVPSPVSETLSLWAGQFVQVQVVLGKPQQGIMVPESALLSRGEEHGVFVVTPENRAEWRRVEAGQRIRGRVEILSGVAVGDRVVVSGTQKLSEKQSVQEVR